MVDWFARPSHGAEVQASIPAPTFLCVVCMFYPYILDKNKKNIREE